MEFRRLMIPAFLLMSLFVMIDAAIGTRSYGFPGGQLVKCIYVNELIGDHKALAEYEQALQERDFRRGRGLEIEEEASDEEPFTWRSLFAIGSIHSERRKASLLDNVSVRCMGCHDSLGTSSMTSRHEAIEVSPDLVLTGTHPMGMDYNAVAASRPGQYHPMDSLPKDMVFLDGKVGCLTCHDPLGTRKDMLSVDNYRSRLCLSCHIK